MSIAMVIPGRKKDLGGFSVSRVLPFAKKRALGPFVFFDHMGPMHVDETHLLDVRPHPHIGLATVTYLFDGHGYHRDTLGSQQLIQPGDINWMTAGRGIAHSERTPEEFRKASPGNTIHGIQIWIALPKDKEEVEPSFFHHPKSTLPSLALSKTSQVKLLLGEYQNQKSPVQTFSQTTYLDISSPQKDKISLSFPNQDMGVYLVSGGVIVNGQSIQPGELAVMATAEKMDLEISENSRILVFGGKPFPEERYIWWNFVSSSKERIHKAAQDWKDQKFGQVPNEKDFIPLPQDPLP